jgi:hypothetical protein
MKSGAAIDAPTEVPTTAGMEEPHCLVPPTPVKEKRTAEELAAIIHHHLSSVDGCPKRGVSVTVYGLNPWNSMLTFGVDAGAVPDKTDLRAFCDITG